MYLIVFCFLIPSAIGINEELAKNARTAFGEITKECEQNTGADSEQTHAYLDRKQPTTTEGKCLILCIHNKLNMQKENGEIDLEGFQTAAAWVLDIYGNEYKEKLNNLVEKCGRKEYNNADACQAAVDFYNCYNNEAIHENVPILLDL